MTIEEANRLETVKVEFREPKAIYIVQSYILATDKSTNIIAFNTNEEAEKWINDEMEGYTYNGTGYYKIDVVDIR